MPEIFEPFIQWLVDISFVLSHRVIGHGHRTATDVYTPLLGYNDNHLRFLVAALIVALRPVLVALASVLLYLAKFTGLWLEMMAIFHVFLFCSAILTSAVGQIFCSNTFVGGLS
jgi:hypothetical protein